MPILDTHSLTLSLTHKIPIKIHTHTTNRLSHGFTHSLRVTLALFLFARFLWIPGYNVYVVSCFMVIITGLYFLQYLFRYQFDFEPSFL